MSIELKLIWGYVERPWGYEVRVDFVDENKNIHNEVLTFKKEPDEKELNSRVDALKSSVETRIANEITEAARPIADPIADAVAAKEAEIKAVLEAKGLLVKGQSISDAKTKAEIVADAQIAPIVDEEVIP